VFDVVRDAPAFDRFGITRLLCMTGQPLTDLRAQGAINAASSSTSAGFRLAVTFAPAEWSRLRTIFPNGACDWSKPCVQQRR